MLKELVVLSFTGVTGLAGVDVALGPFFPGTALNVYAGGYIVALDASYYTPGAVVQPNGLSIGLGGPAAVMARLLGSWYANAPGPWTLVIQPLGNVEDGGVLIGANDLIIARSIHSAAVQVLVTVTIWPP